MSLRARNHSGSSSDEGEDNLPVRNQDYSDSEDAPTTKRARKHDIWANEQDERRLTDAMQGRSTAIVGAGEKVLDRGVESFEIPRHVVQQNPHIGEHVEQRQHVFDDNPFGPSSSADLDAVETFGVPKSQAPPPSSVHSRLGKRSHVPTAPTTNPPSTRGGRGRGAARGRGRGGRQGYTGKRQSAIGAKIEHVEFDENVSVEMLTDQLSELLHEDNKELLTRAVKVLGVTKCITLLRRVEEIEKNGGMRTLDGTRRRTPGGVYLHIMRNDDDHIDKAQIAAIFIDDQKRNKAIAKARRRVARGGPAVTDDKAEMMKRDMEFLDSLNASVDVKKPLASTSHNEMKEEGEMTASGSASMSSDDDLAPSSSRCTNTPVDDTTQDVDMDAGTAEDPIMKMFEDEEAEMQAIMKANQK